MMKECELSDPEEDVADEIASHHQVPHAMLIARCEELFEVFGYRHIPPRKGTCQMDAPEDQAGAISRYREGPSLLEAAVTGLKDDVLDAVPAGGGWTIRQIVHHVVDGDDIWKLCIKMAMGNEQADFALGWYWGMSQQTWGDRWAYGTRSLDASLSLLKATREHILQLLETVPQSWNRAVTFRERDGQTERVPVGFVIQMQADHLFHHIQRIRDMLKERAGT